MTGLRRVPLRMTCIGLEPLARIPVDPRIRDSTWGSPGFGETPADSLPQATVLSLPLPRHHQLPHSSDKLFKCKCSFVEMSYAGRRSHRKARVDPSLNYLLVLNCSRLLLALSGSSGVLSGSNRNVGFRPRSTPTRETFRGSLFSGFALNFIVFSTFLGFNNSYSFSWVWAL